MPFLIGAFGFAFPLSLDAVDEPPPLDELVSFFVSPQAVAKTDRASTAAEAAESRVARDRIMLRSPPVAWTDRPRHARATAGVRGSCGRAPRGRARRGWARGPRRSAACRCRPGSRSLKSSY